LKMILQLSRKMLATGDDGVGRERKKGGEKKKKKKGRGRKERGYAPSLSASF